MSKIANGLPTGVAAIAWTEAARDVILERARQVSVEGWTARHDDEHDSGEMAQAAACYAHPGIVAFADAQQSADFWKLVKQGIPRWPWDRSWWKPKDARANLVRAGALILAEIERLDRATSTSRPSSAAS